MSQGVSTYLMLVDPETMVILWANENVETASIDRLGKSAVGASVEDAIYMAREVGVIDLLRSVAATGADAHLSTQAVSLSHKGSSTRASAYRLPSGEILLASEWYRQSDG